VYYTPSTYGHERAILERMRRWAELAAGGGADPAGA